MFQDDNEEDSGSTSRKGKRDPDVLDFADPDAVDIEVDEEDEDIDSEAAFGESETEKFKEFAFRESGKPTVANGIKRGLVAADFMSDSEDSNLHRNEDESEADVTDEYVLDAEEQHIEKSEVQESGEEESQQDSNDDDDDDDDLLMDSSNEIWWNAGQDIFASSLSSGDIQVPLYGLMEPT